MSREPQAVDDGIRSEGLVMLEQRQHAADRPGLDVANLSKIWSAR
jgi:hypothetical protein